MAARPDRPWFAFWLASISGLAEPLGALVALFVLDNDLDLENILAFVSGVMITVSIWELYPEALKNLNGSSNLRHYQKRQQGMKQHYYFYYQYYRSIIFGTISGACLMIATELYLP